MAKAQSGADFAGEWKNLKETRGIVGANVYNERGRWMVQLQGACHPTPCIWDPTPIELVNPGRREELPRARTLYRRGNMQRVITFQLGEDLLQVDVASTAAPTARGPGFSNHRVDELVRTKPAGAPVKSPRAR